MHPNDERSPGPSLADGARDAVSERDESHKAATALLYLGGLACAWGDYVEAREPLDRAIALSRAVSPRALIVPLVARAGLARAQGERDLARSLLEEAVSLAAAGGTPSIRAVLAMGDFMAAEGNPAMARRHYEQALDMARRQGDKQHRARALEGLAQLARAQGHPRGANRLQGEALRLRHELREAHGSTASPA